MKIVNGFLAAALVLLAVSMVAVPAFAFFPGPLGGFWGRGMAFPGAFGCGVPPVAGFGGFPFAGGCGFPVAGGCGFPAAGGFGVPGAAGLGVPGVGGYGVPGYGSPFGTPFGGYPGMGGYGMPNANFGANAGYQMPAGNMAYGNMPLKSVGNLGMGAGFGGMPSGYI